MCTTIPGPIMGALLLSPTACQTGHGYCIRSGYTLSEIVYCITEIPPNSTYPHQLCVTFVALCQLWSEVERVGFETLGFEVAEKKRGKIIAGVVKACSAGTQITAIMCGGGLLFR